MPQTYTRQTQTKVGFIYCLCQVCVGLWLKKGEFKMKNFIKVLIVLLVLFYAAGFLTASGSGDVSAWLRLYEGFRGETNGSAKIVSSYYLKQLPHENIASDEDFSTEKAALKRVFNLTAVKLLTEAKLTLRRDRDKTPFQVIVLNGRKLLLQLSTIGGAGTGQENRFKVEVLEDGTPPRSLLSSKIFLPEKKSTALGFEDSAGRIYFLSFHRQKDVPPPPAPPAPPPPKGKKGKPAGIKQPRLLYKVDPKYPEAALKANIEGKVTINATTDINGNVVKAIVIDGHPYLRVSALTALKQWKYEPYFIDGVKKPVSFTVLMNFRLAKKDKKKEQAIPISALHQPKLIKRVEPEYPPKALEANIQGKVVVEVTTDKEGNVSEAIVIDGHPILNKAALDAVKQWKYEPYILKGVKKAIKFTVIVAFNIMVRPTK